MKNSTDILLLGNWIDRAAIGSCNDLTRQDKIKQMYESPNKNVSEGEKAENELKNMQNANEVGSWL